MLDGILERSELQENGCLKWTGSLPEGFPYYNNKNIRTYVWRQFNQTDEKVILKNSCGDETCISIHHLYIEDIWDGVKKRIKEGNISNEHGCHLWQGCIDREGYGVIYFDGGNKKCHRISYMLSHEIKEIPEGMVIRHRCKSVSGSETNNKHCNNPEHLESGSHRDNANDKKRDGEQISGEKHSSSKITNETATLIKHSLYPMGHKKYKSQKDRSEIFNVNISTIRNIDGGRMWVEIPDRYGNVNLKIQEKHNKYVREKRISKKDQEYTDEMYEIIRNGLKENSILTSEHKKGDVPGDCWENTNSRNKSRYTSSGFYGFKLYSHVWGAMVYHKRKRGIDDHHVRHLCNNDPCCNPEHVRFGSRSDNSIDFIKNGSKSAKLDEQKIREIRKSSKSRKELSSEYGVDTSQIGKILRGTRWGWVEP